MTPQATILVTVHILTDGQAQRVAACSQPGFRDAPDAAAIRALDRCLTALARPSSDVAQELIPQHFSA